MASLMPQACARCWRRKQRCDRELPECLKCKEAGATCIQRRMGVVIDPLQPDASSYIESLQKRVQRLELAAAEAPLLSPSHNVLASTSSGWGSVNGGAQANEDVAAESHSQSHGGTLETTKQVLDYLPLSAMAELRDRQQSSLQQYSFQTFLNAASSVSGSDPTRSNVSNVALAGSVEAFYQAVMPAGLRLSRSVADMPIQRYLSVCEVTCPFLERHDFFAKYTQIMDELETSETNAAATGEDSSHNQRSNATTLLSQAPHDILLVYIAIATGILMSPDYRHKESVSIALAQAALRLVPRVLTESDNVPIVRSLIALAIYSTYSTLGGSTWHLMGLALARAMSAGMHTEGASDCRAAEPERRESGRLFWALYALEVNVSFSLSRPFCLQDREITAPMPLPTTRHESDNSLGSLILAVQYAHLLHEIRRTPSMGTVFHLANYKHWKEMSTDLVMSAASNDVRENMTQSICSMSCRLLLQILQISGLDQSGGGFSQLWITADAELNALIDRHQQRAEMEDCTLSALDGLDVFSIAIYNIGRLQPNQRVRKCLDLLTAISERFSGIRGFRNVLYCFIDLASSSVSNAEVEIFRLSQECRQLGVNLPSRHYSQMKTILMAKAESHQADSWSRGRRETMLSI